MLLFPWSVHNQEKKNPNSKQKRSTCLFVHDIQRKKYIYVKKISKEKPFYNYKNKRDFNAWSYYSIIIYCFSHLYCFRVKLKWYRYLNHVKLIGICFILLFLNHRSIWRLFFFFFSCTYKNLITAPINIVSKERKQLN